jgi:NADH-ubiquinone oxidoreductase chain 5
LVFINRPNSKKVYIENTHEAFIKMLIPLFLLGFGSIFSGFLFKDLFIGPGTSFFSNAIFISYNNFCGIDSEFISSATKNTPFILTLLGIFLSFLLINCSITSKYKVFTLKISYAYRFFYSFLSKK